MTPRAEIQAEGRRLAPDPPPLAPDPSPLGPDAPPPASDSRYEVPAPLRRRREAASRVRQRRLLVADVGLGLLLALVGLLLAPGLAILAVGAILVLVGCGGWLAAERMTRRRREAGRPGLFARWRARMR